MNTRSIDAEGHPPISTESEKSRETLRQTRYTVSIDREKIAELQIPTIIKEWLERLPEELSFEGPITLIVGDNGSGKSSFARAILEARGAAIKTRFPKDSGAKITTLHLLSEEPAIALSQILTVTETREKPDFKALFIDGSEVMSEIKRWATDQAYAPREYRAEQISGGTYTHRLSSRQLFDQAISDLKSQMIDFGRNVNPNVDLIFDEPEQGLSPQRQLTLIEMLSGLIIDGDTMLVPTNNLALYLSDLPRLDLSQPERGIFRPSDYGDKGEIGFHKSEK